MSPALQISIPSASTTAPEGSKPYTVYHIVLQLPLRKHEIRKRYTDFTNLHTELQSQTGSPPPAPLPAKSWIWKTINNEGLTEERRQALEKYVKAILEDSDPKWRSSSAWRAFLNLPSGTSTLNSNGSLSPTASKRRGSSGITDPNDWLEAHRDLKSHINAARQQLKSRDSAQNTQAQHALGADAKASLVRAAANIEQLDAGLRSLTSNKGNEAGWGNRLGDGEIRRRRDMIGASRKEVEGLEAVLRSAAPTRSNQPSSAPSASAAATPESKADLFRGASKPSGRVLGGPLKETERTRELDNSGVLQLQQQVMEEQDQDVMSLGKTVSRLKDMGIMINEELELQNEMLGILDSDVDRHQGKLNVAKKRIGKIS
ncbi:hypothetical protein Q7P37_004536 [Cladosporium fusiforme]